MKRNRHARRRHRKRRLACQQLEERALLAGDLAGEQSDLRQWHNATMSGDADGDLLVSTADILAVVEELRTAGARELTGNRPAGCAFVDVTQDGWLTVEDLLGIVQLLRLDDNDSPTATLSLIDGAGEGEGANPGPFNSPPTIVGRVEDSVSGPAAVRIRLPNGDAIFSHLDAHGGFEVHTEGLGEGNHTLHIEVFDQVGN